MEYQTQGQNVYEPTVQENKTVKRQGLAIASLVLGGLSLLCCWTYGLGIVPGLIAVIFGVISVVSGEGRARIMGAIGLVLGVVGIVMALVVLLYFISLINWDNVTLYNLSQIQYIDPDDPQQLEQWLQQFFKINISGMVH